VEIGISSPAPTNDNHWSGWCATFAYDAWQPYGNSLTVPGDAINWYNAYATPGNHPGVAGRSRPPRGGLVWFAAKSINGNQGHVGISLGNWQMVSTTGT
jgi:hypothetical protein